MQHVLFREKHSQLGVGDVEELDMSCRAVPIEQHSQRRQNYSI